MTIPYTPQDRKYTQLDFFAAPPAETAQVEDAPITEEAAAEHVYGPRHDARRRWQALCRRFPVIAGMVKERRWRRADLARWLARRREWPDARRAYKVWAGAHYCGPRLPPWSRLPHVDQRSWRAFAQAAREGHVGVAYAAYAAVRGEDPSWLALTHSQPESRSGSAFVHAAHAAHDAERSRGGDTEREAEVEKLSEESLKRLFDGLGKFRCRHYQDVVDALEQGLRRKAARLEAEYYARMEEQDSYRKRGRRVEVPREQTPAGTRRRGARRWHPDQLQLGAPPETESVETLDWLADRLSRNAWRHRRDALEAQERGHHSKAARLEAKCNSALEEMDRYRKRAERARARSAEASAQASPTAAA